MLSMLALRRHARVQASLQLHGFAVASLRLNGTAGQQDKQKDPGPNPSYDRSAELQREQEARANLFAQGVPNPFKMPKPPTDPATGAYRPPASMKDAWDEAWKETSRRFFGSEKPPENMMSWGAAFREQMERSKQTTNVGSGANSDATSSATAGANSSGASANTSSSVNSGTTGATGTAEPAAAEPRPGIPFQHGAPAAPKPMRLLAGLIVVYCSFWMMRRTGMFGNFNHVHIPYWIVGHEDSAKWLLFVFNLDEKRREEIQRNFESARATYPSLNFFDFVDSVQPDWCSSPNYSKQEVLGALTSLLRNESQWRAIGQIRTGLEASNSLFSFFGSAEDTSLTPSQRRIEALMRVLPPQYQIAGGGPKPLVFTRPVSAVGFPAGYGASGPAGWTPVWQQNQNFMANPYPSTAYGQPQGGFVPPGQPWGQHYGQSSWTGQPGFEQYPPQTQGHGTLPFGSTPYSAPASTTAPDTSQPAKPSDDKHAA